MNSEVLFRYYKGYIEDADSKRLEQLKEDIQLSIKTGKMSLPHYYKLSRLIARRKKG